MYKKYEMELAGRTLRVDVDRVAKQANGAVLMHYGDTTVLCTATASEKPREGIDFFPLSVEYNERLYSVGSVVVAKPCKKGCPVAPQTTQQTVVDKCTCPNCNCEKCDCKCTKKDCTCPDCEAAKKQLENCNCPQCTTKEGKKECTCPDCEKAKSQLENCDCPNCVKPTCTCPNCQCDKCNCQPAKNCTCPECEKAKTQLENCDCPQCTPKK